MTWHTTTRETRWKPRPASRRCILSRLRANDELFWEREHLGRIIEAVAGQDGVLHGGGQAQQHREIEGIELGQLAFVEKPEENAPAQVHDCGAEKFFRHRHRQVKNFIRKGLQQRMEHRRRPVALLPPAVVAHPPREAILSAAPDEARGRPGTARSRVFRV